MLTELRAGRRDCKVCKARPSEFSMKRFCLCFGSWICRYSRCSLAVGKKLLATANCT